MSIVKVTDVGHSVNMTPKQYRLKKIKIKVWSDFTATKNEYVLQGLFEWKDATGGGFEWRDIETIKE